MQLWERQAMQVKLARQLQSSNQKCAQESLPKYKSQRKINKKVLPKLCDFWTNLCKKIFWYSFNLCRCWSRLWFWYLTKWNIFVAVFHILLLFCFYSSVYKIRDVMWRRQVSIIILIMISHLKALLHQASQEIYGDEEIAWITNL